jgi:hypothetical protein
MRGETQTVTTTNCLDAEGQPTNRIIETPRRSDLITPVPKPKKLTSLH